MRESNLPIAVLQHVTIRAMQHAWASTRKSRGVFSKLTATPSGFHADQPDRRVGDEVVKDPDGVAASAHACQDAIRQTALGLLYLTLGFLTDDLVKIAHHER